MAKGRIIIVEDERIVALELEDRLRRMGFDVVATFGSGEDAVARAPEIGPDLALLDIRLSGVMDGVQAAEALRQWGIPAVFLTAYADDATLERVKSTEPLGYVLKPFEERALQATIETALFRHRADLARKEAEAARRRAEARHAATLEGSPDAIVTVDAGGRILIFNHAAEKMFGYDAADLAGGTLDLLIPEDLRDRHREHVARYAQGELGARAMGERGRLWGRRSDGARFPIEASISRYVSDGEVLLTAVIRDVSEQVVIEERLRRARQVEAAGMLASSVVHDVNNLLSVIQHAAELVRGDAPSAHIDTILSAVGRGSALTRQLLLFSRGGAGRKDVVVIDDVLTRLEDLARHLAAESVRIHWDLGAPHLRVAIDRQRLEQVILNCIANARDALPSGGGVTVRTTAVAGPSVAIEVSDNGEGIAQHVLPHIFEPFFTTKDHSRGSGLGLWTAREVVREAGGRMELKSEVGVGTTVSIELPCTDAPETVVEPDPPSEPSPVGGGTVLVVDDEDSLRRLLARALEVRGFRAFSVSGVGEALAFLEKSTEPIDVLVTDIALPIMKGTELAERMRRFLPRLSVVYMTGHADESMSKASGTNALLSKPFTGDDLAARVRAVLRNARSSP